MAALREVTVPGFGDVYVHAWWGEYRTITSPEELQPWETVVGVVSFASIDRIEAALAHLPNTRQLGCEYAETAEDYRALISAQEKYPQVDIASPCRGLPSFRWHVINKRGPSVKLTEFEFAEKDFYLLKGWDVSSMQIPDEQRSQRKSE